MAIYTTTSSGTVISTFIGAIEGQHQAIMSHQRGTAEPTVKPTGTIWHRTNYPSLGEAFVIYDGSTFNLLLDPDHAQINAGGTVAFTANQSMGNKKLTNLLAGSAAADATRKDQQLLLDGSQAMTGALQMGNQRITSLGAPTAGTDAARLQDATGTNFYRTTGGAPGSVIYSGWEPGTTTPFQVINETPFNPEACQILIKGQIRDADSFSESITSLELVADIPRWRHETGNGGTFVHPAGWYKTTGGWTQLLGSFTNSTSSSYDWRSEDLGNGVRLYVRFVISGGTKGVEWWLRKGDSGDYQDIDEVGGPAEGISQIFITYNEFSA
ncbi:MAG: hypothetical protein NCW75_05520 [Phycisphaera sp.]|nr:MAG: hypothetical protein NCW75_05520 [Phycisphaera sp.]